MYGMIDRSGQWTLRPNWHRLSWFVGPLAFGQRQDKDCRVVAEYVDRSGLVVFAMTLAVTFSISDQCRR
jgi:hypothetical protein